MIVVRIEGLPPEQECAEQIKSLIEDDYFQYGEDVRVTVTEVVA